MAEARDRRRAGLAVVALAAALAFPQGAGAETFFVNQSDANSSDLNRCKFRQGPCLTIGAAVAKAKAARGNSVVVLPDPAGTKDVYPERLDLRGTNPIVLEGAGSTLTVVDSPSAALPSGGESTMRDLALTDQIDMGAGVLERISAVSAYTGTATSVFDSVLFTSSQTRAAAVATGGRLVRTTVIGANGLQVLGDSVDVLDSTIRSDAAVGRGISVGQRIEGASVFSSGTARLRGVTVDGFATRVSLFEASRLDAVNSTLAGSGGTDLALDRTASTASLATTNLSPARTAFTNGATAAQLTTTDPIDVPPGLTADGHLGPGSLLIDRGTAGGLLAGDPDDQLDIDRATRLQGPAPDVGSDETGAAAVVPPEDSGAEAPEPPAPGTVPPAVDPDAPGGENDTTAAEINKLKIAKSFFVKCPRGKRKCKPGLFVRYDLSEPALVDFAFTKTGRSRRAKTFSVERPASAGSVVWAFGGKIKGKALPRGDYDLAITTTDLAGNEAKPIKRGITVK